MCLTKPHFACFICERFKVMIYWHEEKLTNSNSFFSSRQMYVFHFYFLFPETDEETFSGSESETSEESDSESDSEEGCQVCSPESFHKNPTNVFPAFHSNNTSGLLKVSETPPCKYYNAGGCKRGGRCTYLHVCKFFLAGNCKSGRNCKLNHSVDRRASSGRCRTQDDTAATSKEILFSM